MNKIYLLIVFLLTITFASAYDINTLKNYYSFDSTNITNQVDSVNNKNLISASATHHSLTTSPIKDLMIYFNNSVSATNYSATIDNIDAYTYFSINFWVNHTGFTNTENYISITNDTTSTRYFVVKPISSSGNKIVIGLNGSAAADYTIIYTHDLNKSMVSITYNKVTGFISLYIDGVSVIETVIPNLKSGSNIMYIGRIANGGIDELSIWNSELTSSDVSTLYNSGIGLNYSETIYGASGISVNNNWTVTIDSTDTKQITATSLYYYVYPSGVPSYPRGYYNLESATPNFYYSYICNYTEQLLSSDTFEYSNITSNGWTGIYQYSTGYGISGYDLSLYVNGSITSGTLSKVIPSSGEFSDTKITFVLLPNAYNTTLSFNLYSPFYNPMIKILYNYTDDQVCLYDNDTQDISHLLMCMNYNRITDGLIFTEIVVKYDFGGSNDYYSVTLYNSNNASLLQSSAKNVYTTNYYAGFYGLRSYTDSQYWIDNIYFYDLGMLNTYAYSNGLFNIPITCTYDSGNEYITRFYYQDINTSAYNNYLDYKISGRSTAQIGSDAGLTFADTYEVELTPKERTYYALAIIILCVVVVGGLCVFTKNGGAIAIGALSGIILGLVFSVALGYLDIQWALLVGIVDAALLVLLFKMIFNPFNSP